MLKKKYIPLKQLKPIHHNKYLRKIIHSLKRKSFIKKVIASMYCVWYLYTCDISVCSVCLYVCM